MSEHSRFYKCSKKITVNLNSEASFYSNDKYKLHTSTNLRLKLRRSDIEARIAKANM